MVPNDSSGKAAVERADAAGKPPRAHEAGASNCGGKEISGNGMRAPFWPTCQLLGGDMISSPRPVTRKAAWETVRNPPWVEPNAINEALSPLRGLEKSPETFGTITGIVRRGSEHVYCPPVAVSHGFFPPICSPGIQRAVETPPGIARQP